MHLTLHTDYGLRVLLYLAHFPEQRVHTAAISTAYGISKNHLVRVVRNLADAGFVETSIGRGGGIRLARAPQQIRIGEVVRALEPNMHMVECFDDATNTCPITPVCGLKAPLGKALGAYLNVLDGYSLKDLVRKASSNQFVRLLVPE